MPNTVITSGQFTVSWVAVFNDNSRLINPSNDKYLVNHPAKFSARGLQPINSGNNNYVKLQEKINSGNWTDVLIGFTSTSRAFSNKPAGNYQYRIASCYNIFTCSRYKKSIVVNVRLPSSTPNFASLAVFETPINAAGFSDALPSASHILGSTSGAGSVSGGSASYNIPIVVPPGRNGMHPNINLSYSSSQGNGIAGVGWSVSLGSAISRCSMTVATDGISKAVQYSVANDKLCLNGQRLISVYAYGQSGSEYRTELDSFVRIKQYGGNINSTSTYFRVEYKNGLIETYGGAANARHSAYGRSETLTWAISKKKIAQATTLSTITTSPKLSLANIYYATSNTPATTEVTVIDLLHITMAIEINLTQAI